VGGDSIVLESVFKQNLYIIT